MTAANRTSGQVCADHQSQDREDVGPHSASAHAADRRWGDRI